MFYTLKVKPEKVFGVLLGLAFMSVFLGQAVSHVVYAAFVIALVIYRPKLPWIGPFWWLIAFAAWEFISDYIGPYHGEGMEGGGIGYHFLIIFLPLLVTVINFSQLLIFVMIGAGSSAVLMWFQVLIGIDYKQPPFRINWEGGQLFDRATAFTSRRPWVPQFVHSIVAVTMYPYVQWQKRASIFAVFGLLSGSVLPQIRAVMFAFVGALGFQVIFSGKSKQHKKLVARILVVVLMGAVLISVLAFLRTSFFDDLSSFNGRDKIFVATYQIFKEYPHTGIGGGKHFQEHYQQAWKSLGWHTGEIIFLELKIGHAHSDALMMLVHNGWPAVFLWYGFVIHCFIFVWKNGRRKDIVLFSSVYMMYQVASLMETYLDYSSTTYALFLCLGITLHAPFKEYQKSIHKNKEAS